MYEKKYQIFISSTYLDLIKAREEAIKVILNLYQIPIGMEMFSADNDEQWSTIKSTIDNSDYYLLILGHRYGSVTQEGISYTEKEFDYAKSIGLPIISFVKNRNIATTPNERDSEVKLQKALDRFLIKVTKNSMCDFWSNENELGQKIAIALPKIFFKNPQTGWVKSNLSASIETAEEMTRLFQENRELREELESYKAFIQNEVPSFKITLNNELPIILKHKEIKHIKFNKISPDKIPEHLLKYISYAEVKNFNEAIDTNRISIDEFLEEDNYYQNIKNSSMALDVSISNVGNAKATDLYIDFEFPKEVILIEKTDIDDLKSPVEPNIGINPLNKALEKYNDSLKIVSNMGIMNNILNLNRYNVPEISVSSLLSPSNFRIQPINKSYFINKENNVLTVKISKITHTRTFSLKDKIYIAPLKKGNFTYNVSIICDEIASPIKYTGSISVE